VGEGVFYDGQRGAVRVTAAAVKSSASRATGFLLARAGDCAGDPQALLQYLAAIAWHVRCAEAAAGKVRVLSRRLSPLDLLDMLPLPCMITDAAGRALERSDTFGEFMEAAGLRLATGRLRFDDPFLQDSWQVALTEVDATALHQSLLVSAPDGRHWTVHLVPLHGALDPEDPVERQMILVIVERQEAAAEGAALDHLMTEAARPLTQAEQQVLDAVLQGHSAKVIATARGASVNTVRSQIMAILEKTGHHNQKSLMAAFAPTGFRHSVSGVPSMSGIPSISTRAPGSRPRR
jgi:DNA-binding CsgD family transcriptional regulator